MKKFFGILVLFIGLLSLVIGLAVFIDGEARNKRLDKSEHSEFSTKYHKDNDDQLSFGCGAVIVGLVFFVGGLTMVSSKTKNQKKKEAELEKLKANINKLGDLTATDLGTGKDTIAQLERLAALKEKGTLTEEEFQQQKKILLQQ
jgi:hypothetical protein